MLVDGVRGHLSWQIASEPPWLTARQSYEQKIIPTLGHSTSRFNQQFLDEGPSEFDLFGQRPAFFGQSFE
jgi:hypothetical protein